jgi:hypothetical protein
MRNNQQIFARVAEELTVRDHERMVQDWSRYISSAKQLRSAVRSNTALFEYNFWLQMNGEKWFMKVLAQLLETFRQAKAQNENACLQTIIDLDPEINSGLKNMHRVFHLEGNKSLKRLDLFANVCFREIGDMVEGTLKPFAKLVLLMSRIARGKIETTAVTVNRISFGGIVGELLDDNEFNDVYEPRPWCVPVNQWRNIAQHNSFKTDTLNAELECEYGVKNKKTLCVDRVGLVALMKKIHAVVSLHKIAHLLFFIENMEEIASRLTVISDLSEDTIKSHVLSAVISNEFKLLSVRNKRDWHITLRDQILRSAPDRYAASYNIAAAFRLVVKDRTLSLTIYYKNENGEQTLKAMFK